VADSAKGALVALLALGLLSGCDSTQSKNERAKLRATRELASREPLRLGRANPDVRVERVSLVRGARSSAFVVDLRSRAVMPLTDVPIAVGVRRPGGRRVKLNGGRNQDWFQTHVPALPAGSTATWVFQGPRRVPGGRPFARVGVPALPAISRASSLPRIDATPARAKAASTRARHRGRPATRVVVENDSDVPQYGLQLYALVLDRGRYVAAGRATITHLGTGRRVTASVPLTGHARPRALRVHAIPTIFE
jgi:hypothetical protein